MKESEFSARADGGGGEGVSWREGRAALVWGSRTRKHLHLPQVRLGLAVALEAVLVAALLLAHLAKPAELLQPLGLDPVADRLGREEARLLLAHGERAPASA